LEKDYHLMLLSALPFPVYLKNWSPDL